MQLDADFVTTHACVGRNWMPRVQRAILDLVCRYTGHLLERPGSVCVTEGSLPIRASYCRRCFQGGYVRGDYAPQKGS